MWASEQGLSTFPATAAIDCWALGMIAFELLTQRDAFDELFGPDAVRSSVDSARRPALCTLAVLSCVMLLLLHDAQLDRHARCYWILHCQVLGVNVQVKAVTAQLLGDAPLPWESLAAEVRAKLGPLGTSIVAMLSRSPAQRPALAAVQRQWRATWASLEERA